MADVMGISGAALLLRIATGTILIAHGFPKLPGMSGGKVGRKKLVDSIAEMGFPRPELWTTAVAALQAVGGLFLVLGLFTPWVAAALAVVMAVAVYKQSPQGFVLGADFPFALLCALLALVMLGGGRFSLGRLLGW